VNPRVPDEVQAADRRAQREIWTFRLTIIVTVFSLASAVLGGLNWLFPREPTPTQVDPNFIYRNGSPIGHITSYLVAPGAPNINAEVDQSAKISRSDVIYFHGKPCEIITLDEKSIDIEKLKYSYHIFCAVR
jgi:hypothetical protein